MKDIVLRKPKLEKQRLPYIITFIVGLSVVLGCISYCLFLIHDGILFIPIIIGLLACYFANKKIERIM